MVSSYKVRDKVHVLDDILIDSVIPEDNLEIVKNSELRGYTEVLTETQLEDKNNLKKIREEQIKVLQALNLVLVELKNIKIDMGLLTS